MRTGEQVEEAAPWDGMLQRDDLSLLILAQLGQDRVALELHHGCYRKQDHSEHVIPCPEASCESDVRRLSCKKNR